MENSFLKRELIELKKRPVLTLYRLTLSTLVLAAGFPDKKPLSTELRTFLLYKVWPKVFALLWAPLIYMSQRKLYQFVNDKNWEELFNAIPCVMIGFFTFWVFGVVQIFPESFKTIVDTINTKFVTRDDIVIKDLTVFITLSIAVNVANIEFSSGCILYRELPAPLYIPFTEDGELTQTTFYLAWVYEGVAALYISVALGLWGPFVIAATISIRKEIGYLIWVMDNLQISQGEMDFKMRNTIKDNKIFKNVPDDFLNIQCRNEEDTKQFMKGFIEHHMVVKSVIDEVSRIHSPLFLAQTVVSLVLSCIVVFHVYYTNNPQKVYIKAGPILFESYFLSFSICWSGQLLKDRSEELYRAAYRCPWYVGPHSFKRSMILFFEGIKQPVCLTAGGLFAATFETFLTCVQQSISYVLLLNTLTSLE